MTDTNNQQNTPTVPQDLSDSQVPDPMQAQQPMQSQQASPQGPAAPKDQNVVSFMMQLVQEKYGDEVDGNFLTQESDRLYDIFGNSLVDYFEPMLSEDQKSQFDGLVANSAKQEELLEFLVNNIPNLEQQILQVLVDFRNDYLNSPK